MVGLGDDLRGHIAWRPASICGIVWFALSRNAQVGDSEVSLLIEHEVFRFEIPVNDPVGMHILKTDYNASDEKFCFFFVESPSQAEMKSEIPAINVVHDEIQTLPILECAMHVH